MSSNTLTPVVAGLIVGIAFVVLFASTFSAVDQNFAKRRYLDLTISGLNDQYGTDEKIDFVVKAKGYDHLCGFPVLRIVDVTGADKVVYSLDIISLGGCDPDIRTVDETWTLKDIGVSDDVVINDSGNYKVMIEYGGKTTEKAFAVDVDSSITPISEVSFGTCEPDNTQCSRS